MKVEYAIDLGSSNVSIYKKNYGVVLKEPSLVTVSYGDGKEEYIACGNESKLMVGKTISDYEVISPIVAGRIANEEATFFMLKTFFGKITDFVNAQMSVLVVAPCGLKQEEYDKIRELLYKIGAETVKFVPSSICNLIGENINISNPHGICCVDFGGDTITISIVSMNNVISAFSLLTGGKKVNEAIKKYISNIYQMTLGEQTLEKIKTEICSLYDNDMAYFTLKTMTTNDEGIKVFAHELKKVIDYYFNSIMTGIKSLLSTCSTDIVSDVMANGIVLVGGGSKFKGADDYLKLNLNMPVKVAENDNSAILGAGKLITDKKLYNKLKNNLK